jgi:transposase
MLSPGSDHDSLHAIELLSKADISQSNVLGDKAYGSKAIRDFITSSGGRYTIPPQSNMKQPWGYDKHIYKERHLVECFFQKIKWFRRVATRYDKSDDSFLAFVLLAAIAVLLR